jgi:hypothetical protein
MRRPSRRPSPKGSKTRKPLPPRQSSQQDKPNARSSTFSHARAHLVFDSEVDPGYVGCRATQASPKRRLRFETEDSEIDLEMRPHPAMQSLRLSGQITLSAVDARDGWLRLLKGQDQWLVRLDESAEFRLDGLPPGAYRLEFVFKNRTIELPVLSL